MIKCKECEFFVSRTDEYGECHVQPPRVEKIPGYGGTMTLWPQVASDCAGCAKGRKPLTGKEYVVDQSWFVGVKDE